MMHPYSRALLICGTLVFWIGLNGPIRISAQDTENKWEFLVEPYLLFPYMSGDIGLRNLPAINVDASPGDIFGKLQFGGMLYLEANNDRFVLTSDLLFMNLNQDVVPGRIIESGKADANQLAWEFAGLYRVAAVLEIGLGGRVNNVQAGIDIERKEIGGETTAIHASRSKTWFDPFIVIRVKGAVQDKWLYLLRTDAGGVGIGSTFSWQLQAQIGYQFSPLFHLKAGYRLLYMDYDKGEGEDRFRYNMKIFGPTINFGFNF